MEDEKVSITQLPVSDQLIRSTARIECGSGSSRATGTSFFFRSSRLPGKSIPLLITNRHVLAERDTAEICISVVGAEESQAPPAVIPVGFPNLQSHVIYHPDPKVDLAAVPIAPGMSVLRDQKLKLAHTFVSEELLATDELLADCCAMEELVMIGYPNGVWDSKNNRPIARRGISATPVWEAYEGEPKFLIDCPCFPGSSGSPVFLYSEGAVARRSGLSLGARRVALAGVLHATFLHLAHGEVVETPIAELQSYQASLSIPNSVGICTSASQIRSLVDHVVGIAENQGLAA